MDMDTHWAVKFGEWIMAAFLLACTTLLGLIKRHFTRVHGRIDGIAGQTVEHTTSLALINQNSVTELRIRKDESRLRDNQRQELMTTIDRNHEETTKKLDRLIDRFLEV